MIKLFPNWHSKVQYLKARPLLIFFGPSKPNPSIIALLSRSDSEHCHHRPSDPSHQKQSPNDINQLKRSKLKMVKLTLIARVTDGLPLAEGLDDSRDLKDAEFYKQQVKALFKNLSRGQNEASRMSIETGPYVFHYIIEGRVCYLTMCDRAYPKKLAFQYLEDLKNEFERVNGAQIETAARPYAFIKFDTFIQKTKKLYQDTRTQRNIAKLNDELYEVHQIMTRNVQEVLGVGEKLDQVSEMSSRLTSESRIYADKARDLNRQACACALHLGSWRPMRSSVPWLLPTLIVRISTKYGQCLVGLLFVPPACHWFVQCAIHFFRTFC
ncbi:hypothetical protein SO802_004875 [Lithocarpus litseifolius]|uniref:25.3 kDa vesicle transport protein n=1 Tax=Lithocarpus litseifolius TaxID=425828 RepID=A0AAW2DIW7_9ROSI